MGTGRKFRKQTVTRPRKSGPAKNQRQRQHRERLVALGVSEEDVAKMDPKAVRDMLKRPAKVAKEYAAKA